METGILVSLAVGASGLFLGCFVLLTTVVLSRASAGRAADPAVLPGERDRYRLRFADRTPREYYRALLDQETTKAKAEAEYLQAEKDKWMEGFMGGPSTQTVKGKRKEKKS